MQEAFSTYQSGDYDRAFALLYPFAEKGEIVAQCLVGSLYQLGWGTEPNGLKAIEWYLKAGKKGCGLSFNNLATIYGGTMPDVAADEERVREYQRRARENGFDFFEMA